MNPVDLRARVERQIRACIDWTAWELAQKTEAAESPRSTTCWPAISGPDPE
jgi:hypothetical protein